MGEFNGICHGTGDGFGDSRCKGSTFVPGAATGHGNVTGIPNGIGLANNSGRGFGMMPGCGSAEENGKGSHWPASFPTRHRWLCATDCETVLVICDDLVEQITFESELEYWFTREEAEAELAVRLMKR